ncbi:hypothetical protein QBC46DRAFT_437855 [Diplogelasinospora grovesii]|uniref:Uncharacterized protein n=1 Tax=Diplogelasinospora grovesii TaxID=303347 RepID=A0AAN6N5G7_9PEZI|nr:hypothetical protein QBC46DRAFT_437855 [Diplogelasinospora grovesii]
MAVGSLPLTCRGTPRVFITNQIQRAALPAAPKVSTSRLSIGTSSDPPQGTEHHTKGEARSYGADDDGECDLALKVTSLSKTNIMPAQNMWRWHHARDVDARDVDARDVGSGREEEGQRNRRVVKDDSGAFLAGKSGRCPSAVLALTSSSSMQTNSDEELKARHGCASECTMQNSVWCEGVAIENPHRPDMKGTGAHGRRADAVLEDRLSIVTQNPTIPAHVDDARSVKLAPSVNFPSLADKPPDTQGLCVNEFSTRSEAQSTLRAHLRTLQRGDRLCAGPVVMSRTSSGRFRALPLHAGMQVPEACSALWIVARRQSEAWFLRPITSFATSIHWKPESGIESGEASTWKMQDGGGWHQSSAPQHNRR